MADKWIRVRAHLSRAKVAQRLSVICKKDAQKATGVLIDFWSSVSDNAVNGYIREYPDHTLEDWAGWKGKRGIFATWVRSQHMDPDGRVNDWDEFMGALEARRESDRLRKEAERIRKKSTGRPADSPRDVRQTSAPTRADDDADDTSTGTEEQKTQKISNGAHPPGREMLLSEFTGHRRIALSAKINALMQGVGLPAGYGVPTDRQVDAACLDVMATCERASVSPKVLAKFLAREMRGETESQPNRNQTRASGWDSVA